MNNISSALNTKQYYVSSTNGAQIVKVSFDPRSSTTSKNTAVGTNGGTTIRISIGTKNLDSSADVAQAVNKAVYGSSQSQVSSMMSESTANILNNPQDSIAAASTSLPNEDVMGLLV